MRLAPASGPPLPPLRSEVVLRVKAAGCISAKRERALSFAVQWLDEIINGSRNSNSGNTRVVKSISWAMARSPFPADRGEARDPRRPFLLSPAANRVATHDKTGDRKPMENGDSLHFRVLSLVYSSAFALSRLCHSFQRHHICSAHTGCQAICRSLSRGA